MQRWPIDLKSTDWMMSGLLQPVVEALAAGKLVAVPTETVYGLAADATNGEACARIYEAKGRPSFNPLISHVESLEAAERHGLFDERARALAAAFWPGPLTMVVPRNPASPIASLTTAGLNSVALRVPAAPVMRWLTAQLGRPLAAPSANLSGRISTTDADAVISDLGEKVAHVIDAGPCPIGIESTIVSLTGETPTLLRPGGIPAEAIEAVLGCRLIRAAADDHAPQAPGMLTSHYAPSAAVRLEARNIEPGEAALLFGSENLPGANEATASFNLSPSGDLVEAAANLFSSLRQLDASGAAVIAVQMIPATGLGEAINDRLRRAAAPR